MGGDLRYAFRSLFASRGFSLAAMLTLALGIGANTTIFTIVNGVCSSRCRYGAPERIVRLTEGRPGYGLNVSYPNFMDWRARNHVFEDMAIFNTFGSVVVRQDGMPSDVFPSGTCDARLFRVLGVNAARGRVFRQPSSSQTRRSSR